MTSTTAPTTPKHTIVGPNLPASAGAGFVVHKAGCADLKRGFCRGAQKYTIEAATRQEIVEDVYGDMIAENEPGSDWATWTSYAGEFHFAPCCELDAAPAPEAPVEKPAPASNARKMVASSPRKVLAAHAAGDLLIANRTATQTRFCAERLGATEVTATTARWAGIGAGEVIVRLSEAADEATTPAERATIEALRVEVTLVWDLTLGRTDA